MRLIAGASGVLGSGFCEVLGAGCERFRRLELPWQDQDQVADRVVAYWRAAEAASPNAPITFVWAAGTGTLAADAGVMAAETSALRGVVAALGAGARPNLANCFLFASSAGALYGGHGGGLIGDATPPAPITAYGREKLAQEGIVAALHAAGVMRVVSCRFTNVFGLAAGRLRRKGLVAVVVHSALLRQPAKLFVNPDTRRDYVYNVDAARLALAEADANGSEAASLTIIRGGSTMTVLDVVASTSRVLRRRVPVVITESPESRVQPLVLRFEQRAGVQAAIPTTSFEAAVRTMTEASRG